MRSSLRIHAIRTAVAAVLVGAGAASAPSTARAQRLAVGDLWEDYARAMGLLGRAAPNSWVIRPLALERALAGLSDSANPWQAQVPHLGMLAASGGSRLLVEPLAFRTFDNSAYPSGQNDGAIWQGRGPTLALEAGLTMRFGPLTATFRPQLIYLRNDPFPLAQVADSDRTYYANAWWARGSSSMYIDLPQRFGPDAQWWFDAGQSSIRLDWKGFAGGVSTEDLWWGPGMANAIVMSNNAAGFPHAFLGTSRPLGVGIGRLEAQWVFGRLTQSQWSQRRPDGVVRYLTGAVGSYEPKWLPGLSLGAARAYYFNSPPGGPSLGDYLLVVQRLFKKALAGSASPAGNDATDQLVSVFARWAVPRSGLETYFEWARNDHSWDLRDLILAPEHSQAYTIGFQRAVGLERGSVLTLGVELTHLERSNDMTYRPTPTWYMHAAIRDGYTQLGQIIGAGIGPGGDAQELRGDLFTGWGGVGAYVRRQVHNNDAHFDLFKTRGGDFSRYDVSAGAGLRGTLLLQPLLRRFQGIGPLEVRWLAEVMLERNRYYIYLNDVRNTHLEVSLRWWPSLGGGGAH